jgi:hypothetical protein
VADQLFILKKNKLHVNRDDKPYLGNFIDRLEQDSYEVDTSTSFFDAIDIIKEERKRSISEDNPWIRIKKPELIELIVDTLVDPDKKKILNTVSDEPATIPQILDICNIANTNGYRKINWLIQAGLLIPVGFIIIQHKKKIKKYQSIIEDVEIHMTRRLTSVRIKFRKKK